ncbi:MAG: hypothetical protein EOO11_14525 [Chitinophagaceae bacterium]|nr:MAG: hypothetical protein EOO11_14525 [Chitinophagaceae bacterium]
MMQLFRTEFVFRQTRHLAIATLRHDAGGGSVLVNLPDPGLHDLLPGGSVSIDLGRGYDMAEDASPELQGLLGAVLSAFGALPGFPPVRINFKAPAYPFIHPAFRGGPLRLLFYVDDVLVDSLVLAVPGLADNEEDNRYIRNAMRTLIDKWEDDLRGRSLHLEFLLQYGR